MSADPSEEQFAALLGKYAGYRGRLLDRVAPPKIVGHPLFVQLCCVVTLLAVLVAVFAQIGSVTLFSLWVSRATLCAVCRGLWMCWTLTLVLTHAHRHPLFMGLGCVLFMAEGVLAYRNRVLVNIFAPIMQHTKKRKARSLHQFLHVSLSRVALRGLAASTRLGC